VRIERWDNGKLSSLLQHSIIPIKITYDNELKLLKKTVLLLFKSLPDGRQGSKFNIQHCGLPAGRQACRVMRYL